MKKMIRLLFVCCFLLFSLSGCIKNDTLQKPLCRVVTQVDISCQTEHMLIQRHYTHPEKMEYVLLYLRLLKPSGKPDVDPEQLDKAVYHITVSLSDGTKRLYRQKAHQYFSKDSRTWEKIDPEKAAGLYRLMEKIPSDPAMV